MMKKDADTERPAEQLLEAADVYRHLSCFGQGRPEADPGEATPRRHALTLCIRASASVPDVLSEPLDALGHTNWFQGMWPSDVTMPEPKFPHLEIEPVASTDKGIVIRRKTYNDLPRQKLAPLVRFSLERGPLLAPFYSGGPHGRILHRTGNLLNLECNDGGLARRIEFIVHSHFLVLFRIRLRGAGEATLRADFEFQAANDGSSQDGVWRLHNGRGWHGFAWQPGAMDGEVLGLLAYDIPTAAELDAVFKDGLARLRRFDEVWRELAAPQSIEPFLTGCEEPAERNLIAACVNRALRNTRMGGLIHQPSMVEFYGPEWDFGDGTWVAFMPACRYLLWIEPRFLANTVKTLLDHQQSDGMVPQAVFPRTVYDYSQIPDLSTCVRDYFVMTGDRGFLEFVYPRFNAWYGWWMKHRNPTGDGIIAVGSSGQDRYTSICEYKDNWTNPADPAVFENTCNPFTRTPEIGGRPERAYLPDIVACQARMAEDLAFCARELGLADDAAYFESEYRRLHAWTNTHLWDDTTQFYYPVERATGRKVMKRTNTVFWLMWAGLVPRERTRKLIEALFDHQQFFTTIPVPMVALNDPSFNPRVDHWGDAYSWPIDAFMAFDGLLRYGEWDRAAEFARHYNCGFLKAVGDTLQPAEYYHHSGQPCGCPIMGSAGVPLVFHRFLHDHKAGVATSEWRRFIPEVLA